MKTPCRVAQPRVPFSFFCFRGLAGLACVLAGAACGSTGTARLTDTLPDAAAPDSSPALPSDGGPAEASPHPDAPPDGPFREAPHATTTIPNGGGPVLAHPTLVTITYADDPQRSFAEALGTYLVQSPWLTAVGAEYGVGLGTHVSVELTDDAPGSIDDTAIQKLVASLIAAGTAPAPSGGPVVPTWTAPAAGDGGSPGGDDGGSDGGADAEAGAATAVLIPAVYMVYLPPSTTETVDGQKLCDWSGGGYHSQSEGSFHGQTFPYAVVSQCPNSGGLIGLQQTVSHELIEACTDPSPTAPAYKITDDTSVWSALGGEVGDLCSLLEPQWSEGGYTGLQRVYSNASAKSGGDPCPPSSGPYYGTDVEPGTFVSVQPGTITAFTVKGWSTAAMPPWQLYATPYVNMPTTFMPNASVSASSMNNGGTATLTITIPAMAASQSYALVAVGSANSQTDFGYSVVGVFVP